MGSPAAWYSRFLANRCVPPIPRRELGDGTDCYALTISNAFFREIPTGENYRLRVCFFDTKYRNFFGRRFSSRLFISNENKISIEETLFFHCTLREESIVIVIEIVEYDVNGKEWTLAWTVVPVFTMSVPMTDYSANVSVPPISKKYQLYTGSPKVLFYINGLNPDVYPLRKAVASLQAMLQTHENMRPALNFIPEFLVLSKLEAVPGLRGLSEDMPMLACPQEAEMFTGVLDNVSVSFGVLPEQIEAVFLALLNQEHNFFLNKAPNDLGVRPLEVIERRLRIGIHNGLTFVEDPLVLYLSSRDDMDSGRHSLRRRSRSLSRMGNTIRSETATFQVRNSVKLSRLIADHEVALVFALDYLVGARKGPEVITDSKLVMMCWGAWCPFSDGAFTLSDTITVPLIGGPRPNPDDVRCFKNLLRLRQAETDPFSDGKPRINLSFNFAVVGSAHSHEALLTIPTRSPAPHSGRRPMNVTPLPRPDLPVRPISGVVEDVDDSHMSKPQTPVSERHKVIHVEPTKVIEYEPVELAPTSVRPRARPRSASHGYFDHEWGVPPEIVGETSLSRPTGFTRQVLAALSKVNFPKIVNRNGDTPAVVDAMAMKPLSMETELSDRLDSNEIVIQFMALLNLKNPYITNHPRLSRYFFTLQFYRFPLVSTERLVAHPGQEWKSTAPLPLKRIDENNQLIESTGAGFMVKFTVDKTSFSQTNASDFVEYLNSSSLFIDTWNADSLAHIGTSQIPLKFLLRQKSEAVQANLQCPVVQSGLPQEDVVTALLYLRIANVGYPTVAQTNSLTRSNNAAIVSHRMHRLGESKGGSLKTRAQPLGSIHDSALQRFLTAQKIDIHQRKEELFGQDHLARLKPWSELKKSDEKAIASANLKRFVFQEELEAYKTVRNESRAAKLLKAVFNSITVPYNIQLQHGQIHFFEFCLQNTFAQNVKVQIDVSDSRLKLVTNADEWKWFKTANHIRTPLERDLFDFDDGVAFLHLRAMESVFLPFKFDSGAGDGEGEVLQIKAIFKHVETGEPLSILDLTAECHNCPLTSQFRWIVEESTKVAKIIVIPNLGKRVLAFRCSDPSILLRIQNNSAGCQELLLTCHAPPAAQLKSALVFLYSDRYFSCLLATWQIHFHGAQKLTVEGIQGQVTKIPLTLPSSLSTTDQLIQFHTTSEAVTVLPHQPFVATPKALADVQGLFAPNFTGRRLLLVTAVDVNVGKLVHAWIVHVTVGAPSIVKTFDVKLPLGGAEVVRKRITVANQYEVERTFRVHTSNSTVVSVDKEYHTLGPHESVPVDISFRPIAVDEDFTVEVLIFVEDADLAQQEEAYSMRIHYFRQ